MNPFQQTVSTLQRDAVARPGTQGALRRLSPRARLGPIAGGLTALPPSRRPRTVPQGSGQRPAPAVTRPRRAADVRVPLTGLPKTATSDEPGVEFGDLPGGRGAGVAPAAQDGGASELAEFLPAAGRGEVRVTLGRKHAGLRPARGRGGARKKRRTSGRRQRRRGAAGCRAGRCAGGARRRSRSAR